MFNIYIMYNEPCAAVSASTTTRDDARPAAAKSRYYNNICNINGEESVDRCVVMGVSNVVRFIRKRVKKKNYLISRNKGKS